MKTRLLLSGIFILIGLLLYYLFFKEMMTKSNFLFSSIRNFIPDICWVLSFFFISINFANNFSKKPLLVNSIYIIGIAIIFELLQKYSIVRGTFDILDIVFYCLSILSACWIEIKLRRNEYEKNN